MNTFRPLSRRNMLAGTAAGLVSLAATTWAAAAERGPLLITGPWEINGLAPSNSGFIFARMQITETLVNTHDDGTPAPGLAHKWSVSSDAKVWVFELRPNARFHDGTPLTASAVVRCLQDARRAPALLSVAPVRSIQAVGERSIRIVLDQAFAMLPAVLTHSSTMVLAPSSYEADGSVRSIVGTGPYQVSKLAAPQLIEAVVFEGYDGARPAIKAVRYLAAGRAETRALMAESGQADIAYGLDPASQARLRQRRQLGLQSVMLPRSIIIKLNAGMPALGDPRVRQALSLGIDRPGIARALLRDPEMAANQLFPPALNGWHQSELPALSYQVQQARQLLEQAGWGKAKPLELNLHTFPDRPELPLVATALQDQWRALGISVKVIVGNSGDIPRLHREGSLHMGLAARNYGTVPDPTGTLLQDFGPQGGDWGAMGWQSPQVTQSLQQLAQGASSAQEAQALRQRVAHTLHTQLPVIPVAWYRQHVAVNQRIQHVSLDPLERTYRLDRMQWSS